MPKPLIITDADALFRVMNLERGKIPSKSGEQAFDMHLKIAGFGAHTGIKMSDLVHVIDRNFRVMFSNNTFKQKHKKLGLDIKVIGKNPFDSYLFLPDKIREEYMTVFRTGEMLITEEPTKINGK